MSEQQAAYNIQDEAGEALEILGKGYDNKPAFEIGLPSKIIRESGGDVYEVSEGVWIKLSTSFLKVLKQLKGAKLSVWIAVTLRIDERGNSHPSIETIMNDTGLSNREVIDTIRELEEIQLLTVRRGERRYNIYHTEGYAAFGHSEPVIPTSEESSQVKLTTQPVKSDAKNMLKTSLKQEPINKTKRDAVDFEIDFHLKPKAIKGAFAKHFKLTPNWEAKYNRQFLEWMVENQVTPEQVERAANFWRMDRRFNWKAPDLKGIQEHWFELIPPVKESEPERKIYHYDPEEDKQYVPIPNRKTRGSFTKGGGLIPTGGTG
jgi:hypothetical protein